MRTELKRLHSDTNSTFVYVTHDQLEAMTLSTKVCLMDTGVLQQYAPPLEIYGHPANLFVAEFVGNPTMNFIPATVKSASGNRASLSLLGHDATFAAKAPLDGIKGDVVLGVRPEFLPIQPTARCAARPIPPCPPAWRRPSSSHAAARCSPAWFSAASITPWIPNCR